MIAYVLSLKNNGSKPTRLLAACVPTSRPRGADRLGEPLPALLETPGISARPSERSSNEPPRSRSLRSSQRGLGATADPECWTRTSTDSRGVIRFRKQTAHSHSNPYAAPIAHSMHIDVCECTGPCEPRWSGLRLRLPLRQRYGDDHGNTKWQGCLSYGSRQRARAGMRSDLCPRGRAGRSRRYSA